MTKIEQLQRLGQLLNRAEGIPGFSSLSPTVQQAILIAIALREIDREDRGGEEI